MSGVEGTPAQEITGQRPCDGLRVDLKRCLLQVQPWRAGVGQNSFGSSGRLLAGLGTSVVTVLSVSVCSPLTLGSRASAA